MQGHVTLLTFIFSALFLFNTIHNCMWLNFQSNVSRKKAKNGDHLYCYKNGHSSGHINRWCIVHFYREERIFVGKQQACYINKIVDKEVYVNCNGLNCIILCFLNLVLSSIINRGSCIQSWINQYTMINWLILYCWKFIKSWDIFTLLLSCTCNTGIVL